MRRVPVLPFLQMVSKCNCLFSMLQGGDDENAQRLALLTLGEIGRSSDLSSYSNLEEIILGAFQPQHHTVSDMAPVAKDITHIRLSVGIR